jgi:hypothetical protein
MVRHNVYVLMTLTQIENMMMINRMTSTYQLRKIKIILLSIMKIFYNKLNLSFQLNLIKSSFQI